VQDLPCLSVHLQVSIPPQLPFLSDTPSHHRCRAAVTPSAKDLVDDAGHVMVQTWQLVSLAGSLPGLGGDDAWAPSAPRELSGHVCGGTPGRALGSSLGLEAGLQKVRGVSVLPHLGWFCSWMGDCGSEKYG